MTDLHQIELSVARLEERVAAAHGAMELQATEYKRRLDVLNHAHEKAIEVQHTYVTQEKYEDKIAAEEQARMVALERLNEKFEDTVTRYDLRLSEIETSLSAQKVATETSQRIATDTARELQRKTNRNMAIAGLGMTAVVAIANGVGPF